MAIAVKSLEKLKTRGYCIRQSSLVRRHVERIRRFLLSTPLILWRAQNQGSSTGGNGEAGAMPALTGDGRGRTPTTPEKSLFNAT